MKWIKAFSFYFFALDRISRRTICILMAGNLQTFNSFGSGSADGGGGATSSSISPRRPVTRGVSLDNVFSTQFHRATAQFSAERNGSRTASRSKSNNSKDRNDVAPLTDTAKVRFLMSFCLFASFWEWRKHSRPSCPSSRSDCLSAYSHPSNCSEPHL